MTEQLYIVEVEDRCAPQLAGHGGCGYSSPPQPVTQALALVRLLLGCPQLALRPDGSPWHRAIAGGLRTIQLHQASADRQLQL